MMTELMLVEGVSDVQLISYYMQNVYGWKFEKSNRLGLVPLEKSVHIENLSKNGNQLIICGVGGNGKLRPFVNSYMINNILRDQTKEQNITSVIVVTDKDNESEGRIKRNVNDSFSDISFETNKWKHEVIDTFGESLKIDTYLLVIPPNENGALEKVIIDALKEIPNELELIQKVEPFIDSLDEDVAPALAKDKLRDKAVVGTFFSIKDPKYAMKSYAIVSSKVEWSKAKTLQRLFSPFQYIGEMKPRG